MSRQSSLADRVRRDGIRQPLPYPGQRPGLWRDMTQTLAAQLGTNELPVVMADDVASWRNAEPRATPLDEIPMPAPPWPRCWIEYPSYSGRERRALYVRDVTALAYGDHGDNRWLDEHIELPPVMLQALDDARANGFGNEELGWAVFTVVFVSLAGEPGVVVGPVGMIGLVLNDKGAICGNRWAFTGGPEAEAQLTAKGATVDEWILASVDAGLWTMALCNMRNIVTELVRPPVRRRHRKRGNVAPTRFHVLRLQLPGGNRVGLDGLTAHDDGGEGVGLHLVRGHPAHYGDCCPGQHEPRKLLFGKHQGVYWIPAHMRGDPERGEVLKDYEPIVDR